jgi:hypothetical protein
METDAELAELAQQYLDLWLEYWAARMTGPDFPAPGWAEFVARMMEQASAAAARFDPAGLPAGAGDQPAPVSAAPDPGDERARRIEDRVARLEARLAELERPQPARKPRRQAGGD